MQRAQIIQRNGSRERPARERGLVVKHLPSYLSVLERSSVIVDQNRRREMIVSQLGRLADSVQGRLDPDDQLLEQAIRDLLGAPSHAQE